MTRVRRRSEPARTELDTSRALLQKLAQMDDPSESGSAVARRSETTRCVFVVDRDPHVRRLVQHFLAGLYEVECFDDGYAALDRARIAPPAVVVTEILTPLLDGLALCRLLKSDPATRRVPILVLSMLAAEERARTAGAEAFLQKPLERGRLVATLHGLTGPTTAAGASPPHHQGVS
jgi:CheY-like chemotaxis protein